MNKGRSFEDRYTFSKTFTEKRIINPDWFSGFIDAEGCFESLLVKEKKKTQKMYITLRLSVSQKGHDVFILDCIRTFLKGGHISPSINIHNINDVKKVDRVMRYYSLGNNNRIQNIIDIMENSPLFTTKMDNFAL